MGVSFRNAVPRDLLLMHFDLNAADWPFLAIQTHEMMSGFSSAPSYGSLADIRQSYCQQLRSPRMHALHPMYFAPIFTSPVQARLQLFKGVEGHVIKQPVKGWRC